MKEKKGTPWPAIRVGLSIIVPVCALLVIGKAELVSYAVFASLNSAYGKTRSRRERFREQLGVGLALGVAVVAGAVAAALPSGIPWPLMAIAAVSGWGYLLAQRYCWLPIPSLFMVFATGTVSAVHRSWSDVWTAAAVALVTAAVGVVIGLFGPSKASTPAPARTPWAEILRSRIALMETTAHLATPLLAAIGAAAAGLGHPFWAAMAATVPLSGPTRAARLCRAAHRALGTVIGAGLAYVLLAYGAPLWCLLFEALVLQTMTELFVTRNYGIAVIAITPVALIFMSIAFPPFESSLIADRVLTTVLGVAVASIVVAVLPYAARNRDGIRDSAGQTDCPSSRPKAGAGRKWRRCRSSVLGCQGSNPEPTD